MYSLIEMCCVCLGHNDKLKQIHVMDFDNIKIERKLEYCTTKHKAIRPAIPLHICSKCRKKLRIAYEFKKAYYSSCTKLKCYVAQLKRNKSCYKNSGRNKQKELQVHIMNLGECMVDGKFAQDLVKIENVETQFVGSVSETVNSETDNIVTRSHNTELTNNRDNSVVRKTITDVNETNKLTSDNDMSNAESVNNIMEEITNFVYNSEDYMDIEEDIKNFAAESEEEELVDKKFTAKEEEQIVDKKEDMEDVCKIWVENQNGRTITNFVSSLVHQRVEIKEEKPKINNGDIENLPLNLTLEEQLKISEESDDKCKIWVENKDVNVSENINVDVKKENNMNSDVRSEKTNTDSHKKRKDTCYQSNKKKMKYSDMSTYSSSDNNVPTCYQCKKQFAYKIGLLNYLIVHSYNKAFCSTLCREQYAKMWSK